MDCQVKTNNYQFINILKAIAVILVILTHYNYDKSFKIGIFYNYVIATAVPFFIMITGFNLTNAIKRHQIDSLYKQFKYILGRIIKLTIPFSIIFFIEWKLNIRNIHQMSLFQAFIEGGKGPGSYFYPVIIQLLLIFPFLYAGIKRFKNMGLVFIFLLAYVYEIICYKINMNPSIYRLLSLRLVLFMGLGSWLALRNEKIKKYVLLLFYIIGIVLIYLLVINKGIWRYSPIRTLPAVAFYTAFYHFPVFACMYYKFAHKNYKNRFITSFEFIGKASWHIFLIQMMFLTIPKSYLVNIPCFLVLLHNVVICTIIGILFCKAENYISKKLKVFKYYIISK